MEASQASEAGSIPVARSTTARPRAGRLCYARFTPTVYRMRRDNRRKTLPTQAGCPLSRYKTRPAQATCHQLRLKLALLAQNGLIWRVFLLLGEFCPAFVANKPSRENFLPHQPRHHHGHERNNTPTQHSKPRGETFTAPAPHTNPRGETFTAPARHKQPKITHFHHAGANFLSQHPPPTQHTPTPGRTFFQPPASRPSQPTVACNSTPPHPTTTS